MDFQAECDRALLSLERESDVRLRVEEAQALCDLAAVAPAECRGDLAWVVGRVLGDRQAEVRCAGLALAALVLKGGEAEEILTRHLSDASERIRVEAVGRLADMAKPHLRGSLAIALQDASLLVRFEAARGMAALGHSAGLGVLLEALDDADLRFRAAAALAKLGDPAAVPRLKKFLGSWWVPTFERTQVAGALAALGDAQGVDHLFKRARAKFWAMDRAMAIELLGEVKAVGAKERLLEVLARPQDEARGAAARGLGRLGDPTVENQLVAVLRDTGVSDDVRLDVAQALLMLGGKAGRACVEELALGDEEARAELEEMLAGERQGWGR